MLPEKMSANHAEAAKQTDCFPYMNSGILFSIVELVYEVQLAYYHDWSSLDDVSEKRDIQLVKQVLNSQDKINIDSDKYDPMHLL